MKKQYNYLVSACLAGQKCRYDCQSKPRDFIIDLVQANQAIPVCPEQLGELPTPREPAEIQENGSVITKSQKDVTQNYLLGAQKTLEIIKENNFKKAYLKSKSPMCGIHQVYDGSFSGELKEGPGILARLIHKQKKSIDIEEVD